MTSGNLTVGLLVLILTGASIAQQASTPVPQPNPNKVTTSSPSVRKPKAKTHKRTQAPEPPQPVVEAPPPTPEESPAANPDVTFQNGQLTIHSQNSTLGSILNAVKARTGATVDASGANMNERVATQLGPGDPRDVLTSLLNNSKYDFILLGAPGNPTAVQKIVLTARLAKPEQQQVAAGPGARPGPTNSVRNASEPTPQPDADQELPDAEIPDEANQPEQPPPPEPGQLPPNQPPAEGDQAQQNPNQPKSPEQLLQELQRMQQQQQQQQQLQQQQNLNPH